MSMKNKKSKIIVQVPIYNEEENIEAVINDIPTSVIGIGHIVTIFIDDGSIDQSYDKLIKNNVKYIVRHPKNLGLGCAHRSGLNYAIQLNANVIVNFDADLQYRGSEIGKLIQPILENKADVVIGNRQIKKLDWYPKHKLFTQGLWNTIISILYNTKMIDATSGFRSYNKETAILLSKSCLDPYTYSAESLYILLKKKKRIIFVPTNIRPTYRKSRLVTNKITYVIKFLRTIFICYFKRY